MHLASIDRQQWLVSINRLLKVKSLKAETPFLTLRGMQFASTRLSIIIIYSLLAGAMALPMLLIYFCIFRRDKKSRKGGYADSGFQLSNL